MSSAPSTGVLVMTGPMDEGLSGGDLHALRLQEHWQREPGATATIVTVPAIARHLDGCLPRVLVSTRFDGAIRSLYTYMVALIVRTIRARRAVPAGQVVVATSHFFHDVLPMAAHKRRYGSVAACYVYHLISDSGRERSWQSVVSECLERFALRVLRKRADVVFVDNSETEEALLRRGFARRRLVRTANAYDDPSIEMPARGPYGPPIVLYCGRLAESKGVAELPILAQELADAGTDATVVLAGDGPLRASLESAAARIPNLSLCGFVSDQQKWTLLRRATAFVSPSREEGWGIAVGEALLAGTPAFVRDLPAYNHFGDLVARAASGAELRRLVIEFVQDRPGIVTRQRELDRRRDELPTWDGVLADELQALSLAVSHSSGRTHLSA